MKKIQTAYNTDTDMLLYHTVRKSQIMSKNSIFRKKINKIVNWNFRAKNQSIIVIMIH